MKVFKRSVVIQAVFFCLLSLTIYGGEVAQPLENPKELLTQFGIQIERKGEFLANPASETHEFLRRLGKKLAEKSDMFENRVLCIGSFISKDNQNNAEPFQPSIGKEWDQGRKDVFEKMYQKAAGHIATIAEEIGSPEKGLYIKAVIDPKNFSSLLLGLADMAGKEGGEKNQRKIEKIRNEVVPFLELMDCAVMVGKFTKEGFTCRFDINASPDLASSGVKLGEAGASPSVGEFIDPTCLVAFCQHQEKHDPGSVMDTLRPFPQLAILEGILASAGLSLERDILAIHPLESLFLANLDPIGEGGIPDIRLIEKISDPVKLLAISPGLKQLAMNLGVFVQTNLETFPTLRLSYFLAPSFALHITLSENLLIFSTSRDKLLETVTRIGEIKTKKIQGFAVPQGINRFWKIRFRALNGQLQKLLQSPLLARRGIPPISNLNFANELDDLTVATTVLPEKIMIRVNLPMISQN